MGSVCATGALNSLCLGGALANTYAQLCGGSFTGNILLTGSQKYGFLNDLTNFYIGYADTTNGIIAHSYYGWEVNGDSGIGVRVDGASNVGIGTTTPRVTQEISGDVYAGLMMALRPNTANLSTMLYFESLNSFWGVRNRDGKFIISDLGNAYTNATVERLTIDSSGNLSVAGCGTAVDWIATSDCRLKTCIKPIMGALSTVMQLQGVSYELCDDEKHLNQLGLLAQDVQPILPEIVSHSQPSEADAKYGITDEKLGISYGKISVILIEAIKEQQKQIEENKKQIRALCLELNYMRNYNKE